MKISVVTVCYNAEKEIEKTIQSVLHQTEKDFEYIIIDGNSKDGTLAIVNRYYELFKKRNIAYTVISEPDKGIYDAMNKGILHAVGDYVNFMNAGDLFFDSSVLAHIADSLTNNADIVYGDCVHTLNGYFKLIKAAPIANLKYYVPLSHQSTFVKREILKQYMFSTEYRIAADYNLLLNLYRDGRVFEYVEGPVSVFALNGISETNIKLQQKEHVLVRRNNGYEDKYNGRLYNLKLRFKKFLRMKYQKLFPSRYYSERRGWYKDLNSIYRK